MRAVLLLLCTAATAAPNVLQDWTFDQPGNLRGWQPNGHVADAVVADGALSGRGTGSNPFFTSPPFELPASARQWVEVRLRCERFGHGNLFWSNTFKSQYGGFFPERRTGYTVNGGDWETVVLEPFWQREGKLVQLRFDLPPGQRFALRSLRILAPADSPAPSTTAVWPGWTTSPSGLRQSPPLAVALDAGTGVGLALTATQPGRATLLWATDEANGRYVLTFPLRADGRPHRYHLEPDEHWQGRLLHLALRLPPGASADSVNLEGEPTGPPDLDPTWFGAADGCNRVGRPVQLVARVANLGGTVAAGVSGTLDLPAGVELLRTSAPLSIEGQGRESLVFTVRAAAPIDAPVKLRLTGPGAPAEPVTMQLVVTPAPAVAPSDYVPAPRPAQSRYRVGTFYFPGWNTSARWEPIVANAPWRKPLLGFYDEANPEIADWQIKWATEHGVSFFLVDWYWSKGAQHLTHWLDGAFAGAKYRDRLQWALMWANHNPPGSHSPEDWRKVTEYWLEHYLKQSNYLKIDGKPAIFIWQTDGLRHDLGGSDAVARQFALSQELARAAGLPGLTFVAMNTEGGNRASAPLKSDGYWGETHYHGHFDSASHAADPRWYPYSLTTERLRPGLDTRYESLKAAGLNYLPVANSGWDPRPWHGDKSNVIADRTPAEFTKQLRIAKEFADEHGQDTIVLGPWNEWGEGSYLEPNAEYGFGMLDAIRDVFCTGPAAPNLTPSDVGRGPYDLPANDVQPPTAWTFDRPGSERGWSALMGLRDVKLRDGALCAWTTDRDPAFTVAGLKVRAGQFKRVVVTLAVSANANPGRLQLFWAKSGGGMSEGASASLPLVADGAPHRYVFELAGQPRWRGLITSFRLDPGDASGVEVKLGAVGCEE